MREAESQLPGRQGTKGLFPRRAKQTSRRERNCRSLREELNINIPAAHKFSRRQSCREAAKKRGSVLW